MKITIKHIAKEAKVSVSAVSLVLNGKPCRISDATKKRIIETAEKYNYCANQAARSLVTKETKLIGMIIPDIENIFFSSLSKKVEEYCSARGYILVVVNNNDKEEDDIKLLNMLVSRGVDGLLITPSNESLFNQNRFENCLKNLTIPYVLVDRHFENINANKVYFDNIDGAEQAIANLAENGHKKIGCIASGDESKNGNSRLQGYKQAMEKHNLPVSNQYIYKGNYRFEGGYNAALQIASTDLTAVFICNDMMTLGFIRCMQEKGMRIPEDISVISYDNTINKILPWLQLCSVEQDTSKLGQEACDLLFSDRI